MNNRERHYCGGEWDGGATFTIWTNEMWELDGFGESAEDEDDPADTRPAMYDTLRDLCDALIEAQASESQLGHPAQETTPRQARMT